MTFYPNISMTMLTVITTIALCNVHVAFAAPPNVIIEICSDLVSSSVAQDFIEENINSQANIKNTKVEFTSDGLQVTGTKIIKLLPNANFKALIDLRFHKDNEIELLVRKARVYGVELKWLSGKMVSYLQKKLAKGTAAQFLTISKNGWVKEDGKKRAYSIILSLKPENMVEMVERPVIKSVSISKEGLRLGVSSVPKELD